MAQHTYAYQSWKPETMARAVGRDLSVSAKDSVEICRHLRNKNITDAKGMLNAAIEMRKPIRLNRFNKKVAHKKAIGPGRYLCSTARAILGVIENLEANAQQKGLSTANLVVVHACAHQASRPFRASRHRGRRMKRTHVEIVCEEKAGKKEQGRAGKAAKAGRKTEKQKVQKSTKPQSTPGTSPAAQSTPAKGKQEKPQPKGEEFPKENTQDRKEQPERALPAKEASQ